MKTKINFILLTLAIIAGVAFYVSGSDSSLTHTHSTECTHSVHHSDALSANLDQCPTCFNHYDESGLCPICDYRDCPNCGSHSLRYGSDCINCGFNYFYICTNHGVSYEFCGCIPSVE